MALRQPATGRNRRKALREARPAHDVLELQDDADDETDQELGGLLSATARHPPRSGLSADTPEAGDVARAWEEEMEDIALITEDGPEGSAEDDTNDESSESDLEASSEDEEEGEEDSEGSEIDDRPLIHPVLDRGKFRPAPASRCDVRMHMRSMTSKHCLHCLRLTLPPRAVVLGLADAGEDAVKSGVASSAALLRAGLHTARQGVGNALHASLQTAFSPSEAAEATAALQAYASPRQAWRRAWSGFSRVPQDDVELMQRPRPKDTQKKHTPSRPEKKDDEETAEVGVSEEAGANGVAPETQVSAATQYSEEQEEGVQGLTLFFSPSEASEAAGWLKGAQAYLVRVREVGLERPAWMNHGVGRWLLRIAAAVLLMAALSSAVGTLMLRACTNARCHTLTRKSLSHAHNPAAVGLTNAHEESSAKDVKAGRFASNAQPRPLPPPPSPPTASWHNEDSMPAVAPAHQPPPPAALTTNQMWQHAVCGTRAGPVPPANLSTAETSLQRDTRQRDTGSDSENLDPWRPDRVACWPPFPEQRAAYGRARCAETDAVDVSVVLAASNSLAPDALDVLQRQLAALSRFPWSQHSVTAEVVVVSWGDNASALPLHEMLRIECARSLEIRFLRTPGYLRARLHEVNAGGRSDGGTHGQGGAAGQDVAGVMESFEGLPLNVGIRRSRGRRVLVGPLGGLVSENFLRSLLTPQQVDAFRGRVYAMNHTVLLAPTTRSSCDGSGDQSAAGIARGEAAMCPPAVPLDYASHAVRRRVRRRLLTSAARREQQGDDPDARHRGLLAVTCSVLFAAQVGDVLLRT